jgi:energy-coupling factor transporter ATP-binding protein EcfA2
MGLFHFFDEEDKIYDKEPLLKETLLEESIYGDVGRLDDFHIYEKQVDECRKWFEAYQTDSQVPRVLLLMGKKGCGKSLLAKLLLREYEYESKELTYEEQYTKKEMSELIRNAFIYKNIKEYDSTQKQKYGFLFDDIELMLELGDNMIFNDIMNMIKSSNKRAKDQESKSDNKKKKRSKKSKEEEQENNASLLYNPMICTCNYTNDKKMGEFKKLCKVIDLNAPSRQECDRIVESLLFSYSTPISIDRNVQNEIYEYCEYDIRKIKSCIREICKFKSFLDTHTNSKEITQSEFKMYQLIYGKVDINDSLNDATYKVFQQPITINDAEMIYSLDTLLIPLMIHHNLIEYIQHGRVKEDGVFEKKLDIYEKCMESLCNYDTLQTFIYKNRDWDSLPGLTAIESLYTPNFHLREIIDSNQEKCKVQFTNILNKISQLEVNKKMLQNAYFSVNRLMLDEDEMIYIIEIFLNYLKINRSVEECDMDEVEKKKSKPIVIEDSSYQKIISIMNQYNIDMKSLETILKIEKMNLFVNKNPKRLTSRVKEEIEMFVTAQSLSLEEDT